jgi:hypothetical protein
MTDKPSTQPAPCGCWLNDFGTGHWDACIEKEAGL